MSVAIQSEPPTPEPTVDQLPAAIDSDGSGNVSVASITSPTDARTTRLNQVPFLLRSLQMFRYWTTVSRNRCILSLKFRARPSKVELGHKALDTPLPVDTLSIEAEEASVNDVIDPISPEVLMATDKEVASGEALANSEPPSATDGDVLRSESDATSAELPHNTQTTIPDDVAKAIDSEGCEATPIGNTDETVAKGDQGSNVEPDTTAIADNEATVEASIVAILDEPTVVEHAPSPPAELAQAVAEEEPPVKNFAESGTSPSEDVEGVSDTLIPVEVVPIGVQDKTDEVPAEPGVIPSEQAPSEPMIVAPPIELHVTPENDSAQAVPVMESILVEPKTTTEANEEPIIQAAEQKPIDDAQVTPQECSVAEEPGAVVETIADATPNVEPEAIEGHLEPVEELVPEPITAGEVEPTTKEMDNKQEDPVPVSVPESIAQDPVEENERPITQIADEFTRADLSTPSESSSDVVLGEEPVEQTADAPAAVTIESESTPTAVASVSEVVTVPEAGAPASEIPTPATEVAEAPTTADDAGVQSPIEDVPVIVEASSPVVTTVEETSREGVEPVPASDEDSVLPATGGDAMAPEVASVDNLGVVVEVAPAVYVEKSKKPLKSSHHPGDAEAIASEPVEKQISDAEHSQLDDYQQNMSSEGAPVVNEQVGPQGNSRWMLKDKTNRLIHEVMPPTPLKNTRPLSEKLYMRLYPSLSPSQLPTRRVLADPAAPKEDPQPVLAPKHPLSSPTRPPRFWKKKKPYGDTSARAAADDTTVQPPADEEHSTHRTLPALLVNDLRSPTRITTPLPPSKSLHHRMLNVHSLLGPHPSK
ncbi:hypothetical protein BD779DRAFT_574089 [Infundibulicybe gibba]|nr:hypothetical protein BD779DRAFT_574089 [Infundibulicybe gibba]